MLSAETFSAVALSADSGGDFVEKAVITVAAQKIWGFKVTIWAKDVDTAEWNPVDGWNAVLLRTYTDGGDGFTTVDAGITGAGTTSVTLTWANFDITPPDLTAASTVVSDWKVDVAVVNLDGVESTVKTSNELATPNA